MPNDSIEALYEESRAFISAHQPNHPGSFEAANTFIYKLRTHSSAASLIQLFESGADFEPGAFKRLVIDTEVQLEKMMAREYIAGHADCIEPEMRDGYPMARKEAEALALDRGEWLYFVGCGAAPLTAMRYHDICAARVVCIDQDAEALRLAEQMLLQRYGAAVVAASFRFMHTRAESLELARRSVKHLLLAAHCRHKEALMRQLAPSLADDCRVLVRLPLGLYRHVYDSVDFDQCSEYREALRVDDTAEPFCQAALLTLDRKDSPIVPAAGKASFTGAEA